MIVLEVISDDEVAVIADEEAEEYVLLVTGVLGIDEVLVLVLMIIPGETARRFREL